ncbi:hypothetical protein UlMin_009406, partial [Ulmus minor]
EFSILFISLGLLFFQGFSHDAPALDCLNNPPRTNGSSGAGHVEKLGSLNTYVTGSNHSKRAILLASDVFGYATPHIRLIADKAAAAGFFAVVPDFFHGDPYVAGNASRLIPAWLKDHAPEMGFEDAEKVIGDLKLKGFSQIGAAGFCWGAKAAIDLSKSGFIQAAMVLHPSHITLDDAKEVKVPFAILGAALDGQYPPKVLKQYEEVLKANTKIDSFVKVFPNVKHGWTLKYNDTDAVAVKAANEAHRDLVKWFSKQLK